MRRIAVAIVLLLASRQGDPFCGDAAKNEGTYEGVRIQFCGISRARTWVLPGPGTEMGTPDGQEYALVNLAVTWSDAPEEQKRQRNALRGAQLWKLIDASGKEYRTPVFGTGVPLSYFAVDTKKDGGSNEQVAIPFVVPKDAKLKSFELGILSFPVVSASGNRK